MGLVGWWHTRARKHRKTTHPTPGSAGGTGGMTGRSEDPGRAPFSATGIHGDFRGWSFKGSRVIGLVRWEHVAVNRLACSCLCLPCSSYQLPLPLLDWSLLLSSPPPAYLGVGWGLPWARPGHPVCGHCVETLGVSCPTLDLVSWLVLLLAVGCAPAKQNQHFSST